MGTVKTQMAMSLHGFVADPRDGSDELFGFYDRGDVAVRLSEGYPELHVSRQTADLLLGETSSTGATRRAAGLFVRCDGLPSRHISGVWCRRSGAVTPAHRRDRTDEPLPSSPS